MSRDAFVLWYFFGERERTAASTDETGIERVKITVQGRCSPDDAFEKQQAPVRLDFYRDEAAACSEKVVFGDFGIARDLPSFKTTTIEFTPDKSGEFMWTCGKRMLRVELIDDANWTDVCRPIQCGNELSDFIQLRV